jgi:hypothetical protein
MILKGLSAFSEAPKAGEILVALLVVLAVLFVVEKLTD